MRQLIQSLCLATVLCVSALAQNSDGSKALSTGAASIVASLVMSLEGKPLDAGSSAQVIR